MKLIRTISIVTLAFLVLFSSSSFMVGIHWCGGSVQDIALFTKADVCAMEKSVPPCHKHMKKSCCEDQSIVHEGKGFKASVSQIQLIAPSPIDIDQPLVIISEIIPVALISRTRYVDYDPPLRSTDRTVSHQVFLI